MSQPLIKRLTRYEFGWIECEHCGCEWWTSVAHGDSSLGDTPCRLCRHWIVRRFMALRGSGNISARWHWPIHPIRRDDD